MRAIGRSAVILAGGESRRMGADKTKLAFGNGTMLSFIIGRYSEVFESILLSVGQTGKYDFPGITQVPDIYPGMGPMSGLYSALKHISETEVFLTAADIPFSSPELALKLMEAGRDHSACVVRRNSGRIEPLFGMYKRDCLEVMEELLRFSPKMTALLDRINPLIIRETDICGVDFEKAFLNVNYPGNFSKALEILSSESRPAH